MPLDSNEGERRNELFRTMAVNQFVVSAPPEPPSGSSTFLAAGGPIVTAAAAIVLRASISEHFWKVVVFICLFILLLFHRFRKQRAATTCEAIITVYPVGVQLARRSKGRLLQPPLFIPRDVILDVIVNEVILAHKVVSIVLFRVLKQNELQESRDLAKPPVSSLLKEGRIHLVPAFPGVEMSFSECHVMRRELSSSLDLA